MSGAIELHVNGTPRTSSAANLAALLRELGHDPARPGIAIAVNDELVHRARWTEQGLESGDRIEIVAAVQGG
jgi:sulfur carrier protein